MVPTTASDAFARLAKHDLIERSLAGRLRRTVGFRNVLAHQYTEVDWKIVMRVIRTGTRDIADFDKAIVRMLEDQRQ